LRAFSPPWVIAVGIYIVAQGIAALLARSFLAPNIRAPHAVFDPLSWVLLARPRDMW
jgi:hypothetical protein